MSDTIAEFLWKKTRTKFVDILSKYKKQIKSNRNALVKKCKSHRKPNQKPPMSRKLYQNEHRNYPGMSDIMKFEVVENRGRCAKVTGEVPPCQKIGAIKAFASVIDSTEIPYCLTCHQADRSFIQCAACENVLFCNNRKCKNANQTHQYECGSKLHDIKFDRDIAIKCAIQMVFESLAAYTIEDKTNVKKLIDGVTELINDRNEIDHPLPKKMKTPIHRFKCIMRLQGMEEDIDLGRSTEQAFNIIMGIPMIEKIFAKAAQRAFLQHLLMHFLMVLRENSFETTFDSDADIRKCTIFDIISMFNHSCSPNVINIFEGTTMYLISSRRIERNEELCISYLQFTTERTAERRKILRDSWHFDCNCERCAYADDVNRQNAEQQNENASSNDQDDDSNDDAVDSTVMMRPPEITQDDIDAVRTGFSDLEKNLKNYFSIRREWNLTVGAYGIAYRQESSERTA